MYDGFLCTRAMISLFWLKPTVNVFKMVLPMVSCWWWSCCFCLSEYVTTNHWQASQWWAAATA